MVWNLSATMNHIILFFLIQIYTIIFNLNIIILRNKLFLNGVMWEIIELATTL